MLLRCICNLDKDQNYLVDTVDTAVDDILKIIQQELFNNCPDIHIHLLWTILNLTRNNSDLKRQLGTKNACSIIFQLIDQFPKNLNLKRLACRVLVQLSKIKYNRMAIGKSKGIYQITSLLQDHKRSATFVLVSVKLINLLCMQGITRKQLASNESILTSFLNLINVHMNRSSIIYVMMEIIYKLSTGATLTKTMLRNSSLLPILSKVITHYSDKLSIRNLATSCMSEVFKTCDTAEEDSNETWSSSDSNSSSDDEIIPQSPPQVTVSLNNREHFNVLRMDNERQTHLIQQLQDNLVKEKLERSLLEEELAKARKQRNLESNLKQQKEVLNNQLRMKYQVAEQTNTELQLQTQFYQKEIETVNNFIQLHCIQIKEQEQKKHDNILNPLISEIDQKTALIEQITVPFEEAKLENEKLLSTMQQQDEILQGNLITIKQLESEKQAIIEEITSLTNNNYKMEQMLTQCVDDRILFEWMTLAIRLDYIMHTNTKKKNLINFDQDAFYESLKEHKIPVSSWPKKILTEIQNKQ